MTLRGRSRREGIGLADPGRFRMAPPTVLRPIRYIQWENDRNAWTKRLGMPAASDLGFIDRVKSVQGFRRQQHGWNEGWFAL